MIRPLVETTGLPIFNRVNQISYSLSDLDSIGLGKKDLVQLGSLQRITVVKKRVKTVNEEDINRVKEIVPACRIADVQAEKHQIDLTVKQGSIFACCAQ